MRVDRLETLIAILQRVSPKRFDMKRWGEVGNRRTCGTVACAWGWGALSPEFQAEGVRTHFKVVWRDESNGYDVLATGKSFAEVQEIYETDRRPHVYSSMTISYQGHVGLMAACVFFKLDLQDASWLFLPSHYGNLSSITLSDVLGRLEQITRGARNETRS